jgi:hypothetical protein
MERHQAFPQISRVDSELIYLSSLIGLPSAKYESVYQIVYNGRGS